MNLINLTGIKELKVILRQGAIHNPIRAGRFRLMNPLRAEGNRLSERGSAPRGEEGYNEG